MAGLGETLWTIRDGSGRPNSIEVVTERALSTLSVCPEWCSSSPTSTLPPDPCAVKYKLLIIAETLLLFHSCPASYTASSSLRLPPDLPIIISISGNFFLIVFYAIIMMGRIAIPVFVILLLFLSFFF